MRRRKQTKVVSTVMPCESRVIRHEGDSMLSLHLAHCTDCQDKVTLTHPGGFDKTLVLIALAQTESLEDCQWLLR